MHGDDAIRRLRHRVAELDALDRPWAASPGTAGLLEHAVAVLAARAGDPEPPAAAVDPDEADNLVAACGLLAALGNTHSSLVAGPLDAGAQQWVGTARHTAPSPAEVRPVSSVLDPKPFAMGLHTSTAGPDGRSSWRVYLEAYRGSDLHPLPWTGWRLPVHLGARVREIPNARAWADFVAGYAVVGPDGMVPDWAAAAADHDGVHVTATAVVATQGIRLRVPGGTTAPTWWDVESTFWFRWCFDPPRRDPRADG